MQEGEEGVEVVGRTIDEAVQKGLEVLELKRDQVNVEIISDGARTVFGFRPGQVRVRIAPKPKAPAAPKAAPGPRVAPAPVAPSPLVREEEKGILPQAVEQPGMEAVTTAEGSADEVDVSRRLLTEMLNRMGIRAKVDATPGDKDEPIRLNITGKNLGMLIGRRGETLSSVQFLTRLMVSHQLERWVNIVVDVDDYRLKREETLRRLAARMAEVAAETGQVQELEPMPPAERRIIHLALRDFSGVSTQSVGDGESRRVTVVPARSKPD